MTHVFHRNLRSAMPVAARGDGRGSFRHGHAHEARPAACAAALKDFAS